MREVHLHLDYFPIEALLDLIDEPNGSICKRILGDHRALFERARGSTHNHQTWDGGYIDHVVDGMNYARHLYAFDAAFGRPLPFSLSDALLVFFLHDLEKPWRILVKDGQASNRDGLATKDEFKKFREDKLAEYGLVLTSDQLNGLTYVEGEYKDYSSTHRVMNELAAFCHKIDNWSARGWYDYPKAEGDEWTGAGRFRTITKMKKYRAISRDPKENPFKARQGLSRYTQTVEVAETTLVEQVEEWAREAARQKGYVFLHLEEVI